MSNCDLKVDVEIEIQLVETEIGGVMICLMYHARNSQGWGSNPV